MSKMQRRVRVEENVQEVYWYLAKPRDKVSRPVRRALAKEAGGKCANPGCTNYRTHLHHIMEWAVWETNDHEHMIAICPTCHDAVHHGPLDITDDTIYSWKSIERKTTNRDLIYVEPSEEHMLALGSIGFTGAFGASLFEPSLTNSLSYRIEDQDIFLVDLKISTRTGEELIKVVNGHVKYEVEDPMRYERVPGHIRVTAPVSNELIPEWAVDQMRRLEPDFGKDRLVLLDIEVAEPGLVRVQGIWSYKDHVIVVTRKYLSFCRLGLLNPVSMASQDMDSVRPSTIFEWNGEPIQQHA